jgi:hypothetical protein
MHRPLLTCRVSLQIEWLGNIKFKQVVDITETFICGTVIAETHIARLFNRLKRALSPAGIYVAVRTLTTILRTMRKG